MLETLGALALMLAVMVTLGFGFGFIVWIMQKILN